MFRALALRLVPVFTVVLGMLAFSASAEARRDERAPSGFEVQMREHGQLGQNAPQHPTVKARKTAKAYAQSRTKRYSTAKYGIKAKRLSSKRLAKAKRYHRAHASVQRRSEGVAVVSTPGSVVASVDLKAQRMVVKINGEVAHVWKVSTARKGFVTPRGVYGPQRMHVSYFSKKYYNSPMPYAIFFKGGYAVHGTGAVKALGAPASHGCIRLATGNARALFQLMKQHGPGRARIIIS